MNDSLLEASAACVVLAALLGCVHAWRVGAPSSPWRHALAMVATAAWVVTVVLLLQQPMSQTRASASLAILALALGAWPLVVAAPANRGGAVWSGAARALAWTALASPPAAFVLAVWGVDWLTGIGTEPVVVLSRAGVWAMAVAGIPALSAVLVLLRQFGAQWARIPRLLLGALGVIASQLAIWACALHSGFLSASVVAAVVPLCAAATVLWLLGVAREAPAAAPVALSRKFVHRSVGAGLILAYVLAAGVAMKLGLLGSSFPGHGLFAALFVGVAAFVLAWARWRHSLRTALNRHVFGGKYDYGEVWIELAAIVSRAGGLSDLVQQTADYCRDLLGVGEFSVWVTGPAGDQRRAAISIDGESVFVGDGVIVLPPDAEMDETRLAAAVEASFASAICVGGHVMGLLAAGSRSRPVSLDEEDRELLRHAAAQLAGAIGIYRLGEDLADAREMASFHRLSGFVVHDLKNLAVQQSLVLENAKKHGRDPRFIEDALAAFEDSTLRMRTLIGRLRTSSADTAAVEVPVCDVRKVVEELLTTGALSRAHGVTLRALLPDDGKPCFALIESAALLQVLSHLTVNAIESLPAEGGFVSIAVRRLSGGVWRIEVTDNGCGVSPAYLREHAFRPFRTTKKGGMGMGLYQCRTIVEAAGGSIAIAPAAGRGTTVGITLKDDREAVAFPQVA